MCFHTHTHTHTHTRIACMLMGHIKKKLLISTKAWLSTYLAMYIYIYIYILYMYIYIIYVYIYICACACARPLSVDTYTHAYINTCMQLRATIQGRYTHTYTQTYIHSMCKYIYIHTHYTRTMSAIFAIHIQTSTHMIYDYLANSAAACFSMFLNLSA